MAEQQQSVNPQQDSDNQAAMRADERFEYSAIVDRKPLKMPKGVRMIVWPVVNIEHWEITRPMPRQYSNPPGGQTIVPDVQNWGWHEYGMRIGIWRIIDALRKHGIKPTMSINAKVCETRPRVTQAALDAGWEFMAHTYVQMPIHKVEDQRAMIRQTIDVIKKFTGYDALLKELAKDDESRKKLTQAVLPEVEFRQPVSRLFDWLPRKPNASVNGGVWILIRMQQPSPPAPSPSGRGGEEQAHLNFRRGGHGDQRYACAVNGMPCTACQVARMSSVS